MQTKLNTATPMKTPHSNIIGCYTNGNMHTMIFTDGTKIRCIKDSEEEFIPAFAENMDVKITDYCDMGCAFCHEGSTTCGKHADILNEAFIDTLHPYQELAIGGGDVTSHPDLIPFLQKLKEKKVIANITVNQIHFERKQKLIRKLVDEQLVYGIGVSLVNPTDEFIGLIKQYPNAVIHTINGIITKENLEKLADNDLKVLFLGYKQLRRGEEYINKKTAEISKSQKWLFENIINFIPRFKTVSFDNLAIEQLAIKRHLSKKNWEEFYMGDDGTQTFYIDMVNRKFAKSSTAPLDKRYALMDSVDDMFQIIVSKNNS